jgi:hypothetical protein
VAGVFYNHASELATVSNTFEVEGVATDPTTVSLVITDPSGTATTYTYAASEITKDAPGAYHKDISCTSSLSGTLTWQYVWIGTGAATDVVAGTWTTVSTDQSRLYCTAETLKSRKGITDKLDDAEILAACEAVSRWIDNYCDRQFYRVTATRAFTPCGQYSLDVDDLVSITTLKTDLDGDGTYETTWLASDYQPLPVNPGAYGETRPYTAVKAVGAQLFPVIYGASYATRTDRVQLAGVWGWPAVPDPVRQAAAILAGDYLKLGGMAFGVAGYGEYGAVRARMSNPAMSMLDPYRRYPVLVG